MRSPLWKFNSCFDGVLERFSASFDVFISSLDSLLALPDWHQRQLIPMSMQTDCVTTLQELCCGERRLWAQGASATNSGSCFFVLERNALCQASRWVFAFVLPKTFFHCVSASQSPAINDLSSVLNIVHNWIAEPLQVQTQLVRSTRQRRARDNGCVARLFVLDEVKVTRCWLAL